jgi:hypothetical protein
MDLRNIAESGKLHLMKLVMINYQLVVFIQHGPGELRGLWSWTFAEIELPLYFNSK